MPVFKTGAFVHSANPPFIENDLGILGPSGSYQQLERYIQPETGIGRFGPIYTKGHGMFTLGSRMGIIGVSIIWANLFCNAWISSWLINVSRIWLFWLKESDKFFMSVTSCLGISWPQYSNITVRILKEEWKVRPWSIDHILFVASNKQCPAFLSALFTNRSKTATGNRSSEKVFLISKYVVRGSQSK